MPPLRGQATADLFVNVDVFVKAFARMCVEEKSAAHLAERGNFPRSRPFGRNEAPVGHRARRSLHRHGCAKPVDDERRTAQRQRHVALLVRLDLARAPNRVAHDDKPLRRREGVFGMALPVVEPRLEMSREGAPREHAVVGIVAVLAVVEDRHLAVRRLEHPRLAVVIVVDLAVEFRPVQRLGNRAEGEKRRLDRPVSPQKPVVVFLVFLVDAADVGVHRIVHLVPVERRDALYLGEHAGEDQVFRRGARRVRIVHVRRRAGVDLRQDEPERMPFLAHAGDEAFCRPDLRTVVPLPVRPRVVGRLVQPPGMEREDVAVLPAPGLVHRVVEAAAVDAPGEAERGNLDRLLQFQRGAGVVERLQPVAVVVHAPGDLVAARPEVQFIADFDDRAVPRGGFLQFLRREREPQRLVRRLLVQMKRENAEAVFLRILLRLESARGADPPRPHARQESVAGLFGGDVEVRRKAHNARVERLEPVRLDGRDVGPNEGIGAPIVEFGVHEPVVA